MAKKTDRRAGVIVNASENKQDKKVKSVNFNGPPTRVLLLRNMVCHHIPTTGLSSLYVLSFFVINLYVYRVWRWEYAWYLLLLYV